MVALYDGLGCKYRPESNRERQDNRELLLSRYLITAVKKDSDVISMDVDTVSKIGEDENGNPYPVVNYEVNGDDITVVDMIPEYTHNIINLSETENLVTVMWANEPFDPEHPDTFGETV